MPESPTLEQLSATLNDVVRLLNGVVATASLAEDPRRIYSLEEVAEITGWALDTLRKDCREGRLTYVRKGKAFGLTRKMLDAAIARHTEGPAAERHLGAVTTASRSIPRPGNQRGRRAA
ncbi:hypothetical protein [Actinoplanes sp. NPDC051494]|uniref:hypothetical protein n=1 Tax=Actinoplanes sp. NPDC051494 TaxID=3363907 RepID=UPI0037ADF807